MTSEPIRDPRADHLLTPQNCGLVIIDYQPVQVRSVNSMDQDLLVDRVVHLARFALLYQGEHRARRQRGQRRALSRAPLHRVPIAQ